MKAHSCPTGVNSEPYDGRNECLACRFCTFCPSEDSKGLAHGLRIPGDDDRRQVSWSSDGKHIFAALMETDADIVLLGEAIP